MDCMTRYDTIHYSQLRQRRSQAHASLDNFYNQPLDTEATHYHLAGPPQMWQRRHKKSQMWLDLGHNTRSRPSPAIAF